MSGIEPTFYPPTLTQPFVNVSPPTKLQTSLHEDGSVGYFRNYRNEILSKFSTPRYDWSSKSIGYTAKPEVNSTATRRKIDRNLFLPTNDISTIDSNRMQEVDNLYKAAQLHRSQYKDRTATFHPLFFFKPDHFRFQCAPRTTSTYFSKYPANYVEQRIPTVFAITHERRKRPDACIKDLALDGIYAQRACVAYKR